MLDKEFYPHLARSIIGAPTAELRQTLFDLWQKMTVLDPEQKSILLIETFHANASLKMVDLLDWQSETSWIIPEENFRALLNMPSRRGLMSNSDLCKVNQKFPVLKQQGFPLSVRVDIGSAHQNLWTYLATEGCFDILNEYLPSNLSQNDKDEILAVMVCAIGVSHQRDERMAFIKRLLDEGADASSAHDGNILNIKIFRDQNFKFSPSELALSRASSFRNKDKAIWERLLSDKLEKWVGSEDDQVCPMGMWIMKEGDVSFAKAMARGKRWPSDLKVFSSIIMFQNDLELDHCEKAMSGKAQYIVSCSKKEEADVCVPLKRLAQLLQMLAIPLGQNVHPKPEAIDKTWERVFDVFYPFVEDHDQSRFKQIHNTFWQSTHEAFKFHANQDDEAALRVIDVAIDKVELIIEAQPLEKKMKRPRL